MPEQQPTFFALATRPAVVRRSLKIALVVWLLLVAINHGDALLQGDLSAKRALQILLTFFVPYSVSTFSAVAAMRDRKQG